ncbi:hypothetical protein [Sneathiella aquimaris]|uniref:hypothetical protein n=1 Tax=Sneathiella aquimaris TaxID=2599305 RepID=UPI00146EA46B|nr:hypothetical protein [Sneathiella aquimaris]
METDLSELEIEVETAQVDQAIQRLDELHKKSLEVEKSVRGLSFGKSLGSLEGLFGSGGGASPKLAGSLDFLWLQGSKVATDLNRTFGAAFDDFIVKGKDAEAVLKGMEKNLLRLGTQYFTGKSGNQGLFSSLSSFAGNFLTDIFPGFASGGSFSVGGAAGKDRNLVGMRLTRGETVTIKTPAQQKQEPLKDSGGAVSINFQIQTPDADSFRRSQAQIQTAALTQAQRLLKRNG